MKVDFNKLKTDISLPDFLLQLGWKFAPGTTRTSPKMTNGISTVVIKKNSAGQYTYWDVHDESIRGKSIIDIMQQHIYEETGRIPTLREAGEALVKYVRSNEITVAQDSDYHVGGSGLDDGQLSILNRQLRPYSGTFLAKRGISKETLSSVTFSDVFFSRKFQKDGIIYNNTCIKLIDDKGFRGISQRSSGKDGRSFKGIQGNKYRSIAVSGYTTSKKIEHVYIGESMIDCASHYQLRHSTDDSNILYISTEGNITEGQMELIKMLVDKQCGGDRSHVTYIFDNDECGYKYAIKLDRYLQDGTVPQTEGLTAKQLLEKARLLNIELPSCNDWNEELQNTLRPCEPDTSKKMERTKQPSIEMNM